jgi:glycerol-3-phosphate dehydrogenase
MYSGKAENCNIHSDDITDMVDDINRAYPAAKITRKEICHVHFGLLPAQPAATGSSSDIQLLKNTIIADDPGSSGLRGLTSVTGVKYTTAGEVADKLIRQIAGQSGRPRRSQIEESDSFGDDDKRDDQPEPNNKSIDDKLNAMGLENKTIEHLQTQYRPEIGGILRHLETPERRRPLCPDRPHVEGEISYFVAEEMAQTLSDVLFRRTDIGTAGYPGNTVIRNCAAAMARACDWSEDRVRRELESTLRAYKALQNLGCGTSDSISVTAEAVMKHLEP